jgi:2-desacetyl-2-hydroxyethyl bacteriochlorophyllide A dehydrogenase
MINRVVYFDAPRRISVREEKLPGPGPDKVLVQTSVSGISAGTEMLFYRGEVPTDLSVDETIPSLAGNVEYPLKYGYAAVGRVIELGKDVSPDWKGRTVFALNPHESHFVISPKELTVLPDNLRPEAAVFLANMETAVNLLLDGQPAIGERVVVFGQGVVGLLTTALLAQFPVSRLVTLDSYALRRERSVALGADASLDPGAPELQNQLRKLLEVEEVYAGADIVFELSGNPRALDQAIAATGFGGRVVIGSWYGNKKAKLDLGGHFHRSRISLIASQVSTIAPRWRGRWTKMRRLLEALRMIEKVKPASLITHRYPIDKAGQAYGLIDQNPQEAIQVLLTYED